MYTLLVLIYVLVKDKLNRENNRVTKAFKPSGSLKLLKNKLGYAVPLWQIETYLRL